MPIATASNASASFAVSGSPASTRPCASTASIEIDRKVLADLAVADKAAFAQLAGQAKAKLGA
jgi:hypothetical protein